MDADVINLLSTMESIDHGMFKSVICRVCLVQDVKMQSIFNCRNDLLQPLKFNEMLMKFSNVKINENDDLPSKICNGCIQHTITAYSFMLQVEKSEQTFKNYLEQSTKISLKNTHDKNIGSLSVTTTENRCQICEKYFPDPISLKEHFIFCISSPTVVIKPITVQETDLIIRPNTHSECSVKLETSAQLESHKNQMHNPHSRKTVKAKKSSGKNIHEMLEMTQPVTRNSKRLMEKENNAKNADSSTPVQNSKYECDICTLIFASRNSIKNHLWLHAPLGDAACIYCLKTFESNSEMVSHMKDIHNPKTPFICNLCSIQCRSENSLQAHIRIKHTRERVYQCSICPKRFVEGRDMNRHIARHQTKFPCPVCDKTFTSKSSLKVHIPHHSRVNEKQCPQCDHSFKDEFQLNRHLKIWHTGETHECPQCLKVFSHISRLTEHQLSHVSEEQRRFKCSYCPKRFNHTHHLKNHERIHTGVRPYLCPTCGKSFVQSNQLTIHLKQHEEKQPYPCQLCKRSFALPHRLERHIRTHSGEKPFMCNQCGRFFSDNGTLQRHSKVHQEVPANKEATATTKSKDTIIQIKNKKESKNTQFICPTCDASFMNSVALGVHKRTHTCIYVCDICNRKFSLASTLESHRKTHPEEQREFGCTECTVSFRRPEHLQCHIKRAHSKDRPHVCTYCPAKFCQFGELNNHLRTHTGEKPYICKFCKRGFATSTALTIHIRSHTGERPYKCSICFRCFSTSSAMIGHTKRHSSKKYFSRVTNQSIVDENPATNSINNSLILETIETVLEVIDISNESDVEESQSQIGFRTDAASQTLPEQLGNPNVDILNTVQLNDTNSNVDNLNTIQFIDNDSNVDNLNTIALNDNDSNVDSLNTIQLSDDTIPRKKIYLVNENNEVTVMEIIAEGEKRFNQYDNTESQLVDMPNISHNLAVDLDGNVSDATSEVNVLRSIDGKLTLHLPVNIKLNDGDSFKINIGNMDLGEGTHIPQHNQPMELAEYPMIMNSYNVCDDNNVVMSNINF